MKRKFQNVFFITVEICFAKKHLVKKERFSTVGNNQTLQKYSLMKIIHCSLLTKSVSGSLLGKTFRNAFFNLWFAKLFQEVDNITLFSIVKSLLIEKAKNGFQKGP